MSISMISSSQLKSSLISLPLLLLSQTSHHLLIFIASFSLLMITLLYFLSRPRPIYLLNYACFKPTPTCRVPFSTYMEHARQIPFFDDRSVRFQMRILERSGLGEETCLPPAHHYIPPIPSFSSSIQEFHTVIFSAIDHLFQLTSINPNLIDILVINCSLLCLSPSLSSIIINHYKLRTDIRSFSLSRMGCSAGIISLDLAHDVLQVHPNSFVLVLFTEIITPNYYAGKERAMLLPNASSAWTPPPSSSPTAAMLPSPSTSSSTSSAPIRAATIKPTNASPRSKTLTATSAFLFPKTS